MTSAGLGGVQLVSVAPEGFAKIGGGGGQAPAPSPVRFTVTVAVVRPSETPTKIGLDGAGDGTRLRIVNVLPERVISRALLPLAGK